MKPLQSYPPQNDPVVPAWHCGTEHSYCHDHCYLRQVSLWTVPYLQVCTYRGFGEGGGGAGCSSRVGSSRRGAAQGWVLAGGVQLKGGF